MKPAGKKAKGSAFERQLAQDIVDAGIDPYARRQVLSGSVFGLEGDVRSAKFPFTVEAKRHEKIKLYEFWNQAEQQNVAPKRPLLVVKSSGKETLAVLRWSDLLETIWYALRNEVMK